MSMPTGDSPAKATQYYHYLQSHELVPHGRDATWHVDWNSLVWMWGFVVVLVLILWAWVRQYRSTRKTPGIFPVDTWGFTTEAASPATLFFFIVAFIIVVFGGVMVVTHLIYGQKF